MLSKGTVVSCEDCDKPIASLAKNIKRAEKMSRGDMEKYRVEEPGKDDDIKRVECPECGGKWIREHKSGGVQVHTQHDGWQPGYDEGMS